MKQLPGCHTKGSHSPHELRRDTEPSIEGGLNMHPAVSLRFKVL